MVTRRNFLLGGILPIAGQDVFLPQELESGYPPDPKWQANWLQIDWEREKFEKKIPTDLVVIHHTEAKEGITWQELSEIQRRKLYLPVYERVENPERPSLKGKNPHSGHFRMQNGVLVEVFYAYHWLIRRDGTVERLLADGEVGWHCHNWQENMRSIAICFDGDFRKNRSSSEAMSTCAELIRSYVSKMPISRLKPHSSLNARTSCPGSWFQDRQVDGLTGRDRLLGLSGVQLAD